MPSLLAIGAAPGEIAKLIKRGETHRVLNKPFHKYANVTYVRTTTPLPNRSLHLPAWAANRKFSIALINSSFEIGFDK